MKNIVIACDHGGFELKEELKNYLVDNGLNVTDLGIETKESVDYPDMAEKLAKEILSEKADKGILVCGTGIGISIAANRFKGIRAALVHDAFGARLCREHNNANVIAFGNRTTGVEVAKDCLNIFLKTQFLGDRHERRVNKLDKLG
jgi:ribose 5-phosphate isomerase B